MRALSVRAARALHERLLGALMRAPMAFFHATPAGRVLNRLTKDTADVDTSLASYAGMATQVRAQPVHARRASPRCVLACGAHGAVSTRA